MDLEEALEITERCAQYCSSSRGPANLIVAAELRRVRELTKSARSIVEHIATDVAKTAFLEFCDRILGGVDS